MARGFVLERLAYGGRGGHGHPPPAQRGGQLVGGAVGAAFAQDVQQIRERDAGLLDVGKTSTMSGTARRTLGRRSEPAPSLGANSVRTSACATSRGSLSSRQIMRPI